MPARRASFARWEKPIDSDHGLPIPGRLVFEQSDGGTDRGITQHAGDGVVLDHPLEIEVFDVERIEACDEYSGQFLERVVSGVTNGLSVYTRRLGVTNGFPVSHMFIEP